MRGFTPISRHPGSRASDPVHGGIYGLIQPWKGKCETKRESKKLGGRPHRHFESASEPRRPWLLETAMAAESAVKRQLQKKARIPGPSD